MKPDTQALCLQYVVDEWKGLKPFHGRDGTLVLPPWGVWIALYDPIPDDEDIRDKMDVLRRTWFLDESGLRERDPWIYARFIVVNSIRPWHHSGRVEPENLWHPYFHRIALAAFAAYTGSDDICLELIWGGRYGCGYRMEIDDGLELVVKDRFWIS